MSELVQRKAKDIFSKEIEEDEKTLILAAREGKITIIKGLLSTNMVDVNGNIDIVRLLPDEGAKPNIQTKYGNIPLNAAAGNGHKEVFKLLIDSGADPNKGNQFKEAALHFVAEHGHNDEYG